jgi:N-acetylneuraminic acid mutarotase
MIPMKKRLTDLRRQPTALWLTTLLASALLAGASGAAGWERLAVLPEPNGGAVAGVVGDQIILAGGTNWKDDTKRWLDCIHAYDPKTGAWREVGRLDAPLAYAAVGEYAGALWFAGGSSGGRSQPAVWKMDRHLSVKRAFTLDRGFALAGSGVIGSSLHVLGGTEDMNDLSRATNGFFAIDLRHGRVTRLPDYPEPAFITGAAAACGNRFFAFGGARWDAAANSVANLSSAHAFDPAAGRWETLAPLPYAVRGLTALPLDGDRIFLAGGYRSDLEEFTAGAFIFDIRSGKYTPAPPLPYRAMVHLVRLGDWVYCLGGEDQKKHRTDAGWRIRAKDLLGTATAR